MVVCLNRMRTIIRDPQGNIVSDIQEIMSSKKFAPYRCNPCQISFMKIDDLKSHVKDHEVKLDNPAINNDNVSCNPNVIASKQSKKPKFKEI